MFAIKLTRKMPVISILTQNYASAVQKLKSQFRLGEQGRIEKEKRKQIILRNKDEIEGSENVLYRKRKK